MFARTADLSQCYRQSADELKNGSESATLLLLTASIGGK